MLNKNKFHCVVAKFAKEQIAPLVKEMEANGKLDDGLVKALFENGLMGIEIPEEFGGSGCNFMTSILAVEEISKVDPATSVLVDIQNTLVNALILKLGTREQKEKFLTKLATSSVRSFAMIAVLQNNMLILSLAQQFCTFGT